MPAAPLLPASSPQTLLGIGYMVLAVSLFGVMDAVVKWLTAAYPTPQIMFCRSLFAFPPILWIVWRRGGFGQLRTHRIVGHGLRSLYGCVAMFGFFHAYRTLPLADVTAIAFAAPIFIALLSVVILREKVGKHRWAAIFVGFLGMLLIVRPGAGISEGTLLVVAATALYALAMIQIRLLSAGETAASIAFYFTLFCTIVTGAMMPWLWVAPDGVGWIGLVAVGLFGGLAQLLMTRAYGMAPASVVAPFDYTHLLWSVAIGWYVWGDFPDAYTWAGSAVVIASGLYILYRETVRHREATPRWSE